ncbi:hypothetical protein Poli38472_011820 [Pythium oligandrum]|uniref:Uncharacterized protein n=1 Tax=Pythium oligandrum TaxID=41045 RepID=A0A8K1FG14_PYTOL|nr:hypothetical protein Poli38472_011820 [Pythium oligandrum]|eukprot:TMW58232.1 hypothetical protein Poli38472_011820 [Pythium oligandrum]
MADNQSFPLQARQQYAVETLRVNGTMTPAPRGGATLSQLENGEIYLIGGANRETHSFGDAHRFDFETKTWSLVVPERGNLPARSGHSAIAIGDEIVVFGGLDPTECIVYDDVHIFSTRTRQWRQPDVEGWMPQPRNAHAAIRLPDQDGQHRILIYGGSSPSHGAFDDLYVLEMSIEDRAAPLRWDRIEDKQSEGAQDEIPEARELHIATFLTDKQVCFSGGRNRDGSICTDMALLDIESWRWQLVPICEWNRCSHAAGLVDGTLVSFGGWNGGAITDDTWEYADNEESWLSAQITSPSKDEKDPERDETQIPERFGHCGCTIQPNKDSPTGLLVFGGMNGEQDLNDLVWITCVSQT